jgi:uncharacterized protein with GYD domain
MHTYIVMFKWTPQRLKESQGSITTETWRAFTEDEYRDISRRVSLWPVTTSPAAHTPAEVIV